MSILKNRDFRSLFLTRALTATGLQIQAVIVGWQIYQIRPDPLLLGYIGLVEAIPAISGSFISGHFVDVHKPAKILGWSVFALFLNACLLFFAAHPASPLAPDLRLFMLYFGIFVSGAARSFTSPSIFTLIPRAIQRHELGEASALNSTAYQVASIAGPAIGGLVYGFAGVAFAFALPPLMQLASWFMQQQLSKSLRSTQNHNEREPALKSIANGVRFTLGHRVLLSTMMLDMFSVLFGGAVVVLPMFADQVFKSGATGLGLLRAAPAVGSGLVALYLATKPMKVISGRTLTVAVTGFGAATIGFGLSNQFYLALFFLAALGAFDGVSMVIRSTMLQLLTPENMRGRVSAMSSVFITSSNELGAFESGIAARFLGLIPSVVFGGAMTLVVVAMTLWRAPELEKTRIAHDSPS